MVFSTEAANNVFEENFAVLLRTLLDLVQQETAAELGAKIAAAWVNTQLELERLGGRDRHLPEDGRTLSEDLENEVVTFATLHWDTLRRSQKPPTYPASGKPANSMISTTVKKQYEEKLKQRRAGAAADRAAAASMAGPPGLPVPVPSHSMSTPEKDGKGTLVQQLLARADGDADAEDDPSKTNGDQSGNEQGGRIARAAAVPPPLVRACRRLMDPGPPDLRVERQAGALALHMLKEKWTFTDWIETQGLTGQQLREGRTHARALELGVEDMGPAYLLSRSAEVTLRRMLSLAVTAAAGNARMGTKVEELPREGVLAALPESMVKDMAEELKLELKIEQLMKGNLPK